MIVQEHLDPPEKRAFRIGILRSLLADCGPQHAVKADIIERRIWLLENELPWPITPDDEPLFLLSRNPTPAAMLPTTIRTRRGTMVTIPVEGFDPSGAGEIASLMGGW